LANRHPTIFHITHWKAGSQWVAEILKYCAPERFVRWEFNGVNFRTKPLKSGNIYGTVYLPRQEFDRITTTRISPRQIVLDFFQNPSRVAGNWLTYGIQNKPITPFVVIRDLRDTLVSLYFSAKHSHILLTDSMYARRKMFNELEESDGILMAMTDDNILANASMKKIVDIQRSWVNDPNVLCLRYENILGNEFAFFESLIDYCKINVSHEHLHDIVKHNVFEVVTGRKKGDEDVNAHLRKGVAGDWRNHFTDQIKDEFKSLYGQVLIDTGYEKDFNW